MHKKFIDKLAFIDIKDCKMLVTLSRGKDVWYIPGGKREEKETDIQALSREIYEELSVSILPHSAKLYGIFDAPAHGKPEGVLVRMTCYTASYTGSLKPSAEIQALDYFSYRQKHLCSVVDNLIFDHVKQNGLID